MRKLSMKKAAAIGLASIMVMSMPVTALAATHEVGTGDELSTAFNNDPDSEVVINLTADINAYYDLVSRVGQTYTINGQDYTLTGVSICGDGGDVTINADVHGEAWGSALEVDGPANVTVNGDVIGGDAQDYSGEVVYSTFGLTASNGANVTVNGNVYGGNGTEEAAEVVGYSSGHAAIYAEDDSTVTVTGDAIGGSGVYLPNSDLSYASVYAGSGIDAYDNATVTVEGSAVGGDVTVDSENEYIYAYAGDGVGMDSTCNVTVGGDAVGGSIIGEAAEGESGHGVNNYVIFEAEDEEEEIVQGSVTVEGTAVGGDSEPEYIDAGNAVHYNFAPVEIDDQNYYLENVLVEPVEDAEEAEEMLQYGMQYDVLWRAAYVFSDRAGSFEKDHRELLSYLFELISEGTGVPVEDGVAEEFMTYFCNDYYYFDTEEEFAAAFPSYYAFVTALGALSEGVEGEDALDLMNAIINAYNKSILKMLLPETDLPNVTVHGMQAVEDLIGGEFNFGFSPMALYSDDDEPQSIEDMLLELALEDAGAEINYLVRIEESENGSVSTDQDTYNLGDTMTITVTPDEGYELDVLTVRGEVIEADEDGNYTYVVTEEEGFLVVEATFKTTDTIVDPDTTDETTEETPAETPEETTAETPAVVGAGVQTGDNSHIILWSAALGLAIVAAAGSLVVSRKRR